MLPEFTGERVIPNMVDPNLFNEHLARYRFASRLCTNAAVLDAGCGSGYGTAELTGATSVTAIDIAPDALAYAREHFGRPGVRFVNAACEALPFADAAFDLVAAFEVIEHLERWPDLLAEARRVLKPAGTLLVSTPNKAVYTEMRADVGPNPFHCHEFEYEEFQAALYAVFPHVRIWAQNHAETIVFAPLAPRTSVLEAAGDAAPQDSHFFLAACSQSPIRADDLFAWLPDTGNVLREREHHIAKLKGELARKDAWLDELHAKHESLQRSHEAAIAELDERAHWTEHLNGLIRERDETIRGLQAEAEERYRWIGDREKVLSQAHSEIIRLRALNSDLESDLKRRTAWALSFETELKQRTQWVWTLEAELTERTEHVRLLELQIAEHSDRLIAQNRVIAERDAELAERDVWIARLHAEIEHREGLIRQYAALVEQKDASVGERDAMILERDAMILERDAIIRERDASIADLGRRLDDTTEQFEAATALHQRYLRELTEIRRIHTLIAQSKWIRLGRSLNLGPVVTNAGGE